MENEIIQLPTLERYIEKYPEDAEKWLEFIKEDELPNIQTTLRRTPPVALEDDLLKFYKEFHNTRADNPISSHTDGCLLCKKSWESTQDIPRSTLLCGHSYHTICSCIDQYDDDRVICSVEGCTINSWDYVRNIIRTKEVTVTRAENILLDSYVKRKDFKQELKGLKGAMKQVVGAHKLVLKLSQDKKKELLHKHIFTVNQIQRDINDSVTDIRNSQQMNEYKNKIKNYRKTAGSMFRKYHVGFRDLYRRGLLRCSWKIRWVLERHRNPFSFYRHGFRLRVGKKIWKDPLEEVPEDLEDLEA
jgi:hypothetical protein